MPKNVFLNIELKNNLDIDNDLIAKELAKKMIDTNLVKNVQFRYGIFGRVDKLHLEKP